MKSKFSFLTPRPRYGHTEEQICFKFLGAHAPLEIAPVSQSVSESVSESQKSLKQHQTHEITCYGHVWSHMVPYGPVWSLMVLYGPLWSYMVPYGPI